MPLCTTTGTPSAAGARPGPAILVIVLVLVIAAARAGYTPPELITTLMLCAGLAGLLPRIVPLEITP